MIANVPDAWLLERMLQQASHTGTISFREFMPQEILDRLLN
jgi:hypothetical protein